jgi:hypothetical protein
MPDAVFEVACKQCGRSLVRTERIRDPEIAILEDHLRACSPLEPLGDNPPLGQVMARVKVAAVARA